MIRKSRSTCLSIQISILKLAQLSSRCSGDVSSLEKCVGHRPPQQFVDLTSPGKPLYVNASLSSPGKLRRGPKRHQSPDRFDEEERSLRFRDGEGWLSYQTAKRFGRPTDHNVDDRAGGEDGCQQSSGNRFSRKRVAQRYCFPNGR